MQQHALLSRVQRLRILVVDDEPYARKVTRTILTAIGVKEILEATDGIEGFEIAGSELPDVIIVDWEMPVIDGPQFIQMIRSPGDFVAPDVPIVLLTSHCDPWHVKESARLGANEFVRKPVSIKTLQDRLLAIVGNPRPSVKLDGYYGPMPRRLVPITT